MQFTETSNSTRWFIIISSFLIVLLILWNTYNFFQIFKNEERNKMELLAESLKTIEKANLETDDIELPRQIITNNTTIPVVITNQNSEILNHSNVEEEITNDSIKLKHYFNDLKKENSPIKKFKLHTKKNLKFKKRI